MTSFKKLLTALLLLSASASFAQTQLYVPSNLQKTYTKGTRTVTGEPGSKYWQNRADYLIKVNFDPKTRLLSGTVDIDYVNNSPDTLKSVVFKLYPNFYKKYNDVGYKTAKRRVKMELEELLTIIIVKACGGDPDIVFR